MTFFLVIGVFLQFYLLSIGKDVRYHYIQKIRSCASVDSSVGRTPDYRYFGGPCPNPGRSGPSIYSPTPYTSMAESDCACIQLNWWGRGRGVVRMFHCLLAFLIVWVFFQFRPRVHFPHKNLERNRNQRGKVLYET